MATLHVTEYRALATDQNGRAVLVGEEPSIITQHVTYTTAAASAAFNGKTKFVRVIASADAYLFWTVAGTAATTANGTLVKANVPEYFGVGIALLKVSAYDGTS